MNAVAENIFASGVLSREEHLPLVNDIRNITSIAGVPESAVCTSCKPFLSSTERDWFGDIFDHMEDGRKGGLILTCKGGVSPQDKMVSIVGAMLRNYVDARLMSLRTVLRRFEEDEDLMFSVLCIQNFYMEGQKIPSWKVSDLYDLLLQRLSRSKITVLYISDVENMAKEYGAEMTKLLQEHYDVI